MLALNDLDEMPGKVVRGLPTFPALGYQLHARLQWADCQ